MYPFLYRIQLPTRILCFYDISFDKHDAIRDRKLCAYQEEKLSYTDGKRQILLQKIIPFRR